MSEKTTGKTANFTLDPANPPALSAEAKARLTRLASMPDSAIDHSDIPATSADAAWTRPGPLVVGNKQQLTLRLDRDVVDFFKQSGRRYQTRINAVLRAFVDANRHP